MTTMTNTTTTTGHWCHLDSREYERTHAARTVCSSRWTSDWFRTSVEAVDAGLAHTGGGAS